MGGDNNNNKMSLIFAPWREIRSVVLVREHHTGPLGLSHEICDVNINTDERVVRRPDRILSLITISTVNHWCACCDLHPHYILLG